MSDTHPSLDTAGTLRSLGERRFATRVTAQDLAVRDHLVHRTPVLPGVFHLDLVLRLVRGLGVDPAMVELRRCVFIRPLIAVDDLDRQLEVTVSEAGPHGGVPVTVRSRPLLGGEVADETWQTNFQAEIHSAGRWNPEPVPAGRLSTASGTGAQDADDLYGLARQLDIEHGPFMKVRGTVARGPDFSVADVRLDPSAVEALGHFYVHPVFMDFSVLVPFLQFPEDVRSGIVQPFIPIYIDSFRARGSLEARTLVHAPRLANPHVDDSTQAVVADIDLCTPDGEVVVRLSGYRAKRVRTTADIRKHAEEGKRLAAGEVTDLAAGEQSTSGEQQGAQHGREPVPPAGTGTVGTSAPASPPARDLTDVVIEAIADHTGKPGTAIHSDQGFYDELGLTSVDLLTIAGKLESALDTELYPTLLFEHPTIAQLVTHLAAEGVRPPAAAPLPVSAPAPDTAPAPALPPQAESPSHTPVLPVAGTPASGHQAPMAIVGVAGRYPGARNLDEFWEVLRAGADRLSEVPTDRWDADAWYAAEPGTPGRTYLTRGGFIEDVDRFDSLFFNIPPQQAKLMDPHERQFLEVAWSALEDAGHTPESLSAAADGLVGVFAGSMWADYQLHGLENVRDGGSDVALSWLGGVPNRVSHAFDFRGPSVLTDTACSSSLTALHQACESIRRGECGAALVGGVSLSLHPYKYVRSAAHGLLSKDGTSRPFGEGASGYVPADGVGALVIRPLADAEADGDRVLAVVRGSAVNHTGRTPGYTVTSPDSQSRVVRSALTQAGVPAETVTLLEAHGATTALGDQLEVDALTRTFRQETDARGFCALGSVKANIGHTEAAAGIASLTKVLLCLRHRTLVPTPHGERANSAIDFAASPFRLPRQAEPWEAVMDQTTGRTTPLRAGVSAFGFGGANAHVVLEEYVPSQPPSSAPSGTDRRVVALSARTSAQLASRASALAEALRTQPSIQLADVAHTLAVGRRHFGERLALVASSVTELLQALEDFGAERPLSIPSFRATPPRTAAGASLPPSAGPEELARNWAHGTGDAPGPTPGGRRIALPTYPFAGERHWTAPPTLSAPSRTPSTPGPAPQPEPAQQPDPVSQSVSAPAVATFRPGTGTVPLADLAEVMLYEPAWGPRSAPTPSETPAVGPVLVLDTSEVHAEAVRASARSAVLVTPGTGFSRLSAERFTVRPDSTGDHKELRAVLEREGRVPSAVLHLWHLEGVDPAGPPDRPTGLLSVYALCQAWAVGRRVPLPVVHAYHASTECPPDAAVGGLARGLRLEQPKLPLSTVQFALPQRDPARTVALLLAEAAAPGDPEVRHTSSGTREVRGFAPTTPVPSGTPLARRGGTYLITGGTGGIARHVARRMARAAQPAIVLCGRSPEGERQRELVAELTRLGSPAIYVQADVTQLDDVRGLVATAEERFGAVTGIIHTAGVVEDGLLINKTPDSLRRVLAPKLEGTRNLDTATADRKLDYLVLFSSTSAVLGSIGTTDYTAANAYLDAFAAWREGLLARGERHGHCVSLNWPLWDEGGMRINPAVEAQVLESTGLVPLRTAHGLAALEAGLAHDGPQLAVFEGDRSKVESLLRVILPERVRSHPRTVPVPQGPAPAAESLESAVLRELETVIADAVSELLPETGGMSEELFTWTFMELGLGSVEVVALGERLGERLGVELLPTVFFRCTRVPELAAHLVHDSGEAVRGWYAKVTDVAANAARTAGPSRLGASPTGSDPSTDGALSTDGVGAKQTGDALRDVRDIAVIGLAGRFPGAADVRELWEAFLTGRDLVGEVPGGRWDHSRYLDAQGAAGTTECPAGGFVDDVSRFDAAFFGIPHAEAEAMDPQLRLLLEVLYETAEDAAVLPALRGSDTGVFVGECFRDYEGEMIAGNRKPGPYDATGIATTMAANRPSHYFDLAGPSLTVDTACSSSLHALHLAVESLRRGECAMAFAAGANLMLSPRHYLSLSGTGALSPSGRCHAFDERADGYVPAEAVAAVLLKPLGAALADGDPIRAVIKGVAVGHGGRAGAVTAPSPQRQSALIERAWRDAGVPVHTMGLLEAHGTGTKLGDPIEIEGLRGALASAPAKTSPILLGTAKAHLGHSEGAAGIVGVIKAVLSLEGGMVPAMPNWRKANPYLALGDDSIAVPTTAVRWRAPDGLPRRAGVSSFGFGGANAHAVVEEAPARPRPPADQGASRVVPLSASSAEELAELLRRQRAALLAQRDLAAVAATLQQGREALPARIAIVAATCQEAVTELDDVLARPALVPGTVRAVPGSDADAVAAAERWVSGEPVEWTVSVGGGQGPRLNLPGRPFRGERFWLRECDPHAQPHTPTPSTVPAGVPLPVGGESGPVAGALEAARTFMASSGYDAAGVRRGLERLSALGARLAALSVREYLGVRGRLSAADVLSGLPAVEPYGPFMTRLAELVANAPVQPGHSDAERALITREFADLCADHPQVADLVALARAVIPHIPAVASGQLSALEMYFSEPVEEILNRVYTSNAIAQHYNAIVAHLAERYVRDRLARQPDRPVRVLEVGAGTGGTTGPVLDRLAPLGARVEYTFTDVSASYFRQAKRRFSASGVPLVLTPFNLERDPALQGLEVGAYDLLIASNVVHATADITVAASHLKRLLADGGFLLLNELTSHIDYQLLLFGMIPSWWSCEDDERLPGTPLLAPARWQRVLAQAGFEASWVQRHENGVLDEDDQCVIVARADGPTEPASTAGSVTDTLNPAPVTAPVADPPAAPDTPEAAEAAAEEAEGNLDISTAVRVHLRQTVAEFLSVPVATVDDETPFGELGVDSLGTIQLVRELEEVFGKLPKVLLYEAGTVTALAEELADRSPEACADIARAAAPAPVRQPSTRAAREPGAVPTTPELRADSPVASPPASPTDPVAIVGMAVHLPGARTVGELWRNLLTGTDHMTEIPRERWDWRPLFGDPHREEGRTNSKWGAFVDGVTEFDADFFGISGREAEVMDPQQRLMLQTAWHAVEDSGHAPSTLRDSDTGVFVGATSHDYTAHLAQVGRYREPYAVNGNAKTVLANRVSFELGLHGPSETVDTACSSSLSALHRAVRAIEGQECSAALVGGVHLLLTADMFVALGQMGALSPDGKCHAFDRDANGFSRGEGVIALYLKPLSRALDDGDTVHALVRGSGVNHGGRVQSLPVPNPAAQAALIARVLRRSDTDPRTIGYVEAHGTGTEVGDPIELRGLRSAFAQASGTDEDVDAWCAVGSIKSNMGHLEAAAGLAGVAKAVLCLRHQEIAPTINFREPNPLLELEGSPFRVADRRTAWPAPVDAHGRVRPRRAAVSAMGFGGSNAHVVLEEYPAHAPRVQDDTTAPRAELFVLSARSEDRLAAAARSLADHLDGESSVSAAEVAHTLRSGRDSMEWRLAVVATGLPDCVAALRSYVAHGTADGLVAGRRTDVGKAVTPADDLPALGRQWVEGRVDTAALSVRSGDGQRRVRLPGYPFTPQRFWAKAPVAARTGHPPKAPADQESQELVAMLDALSRGELTVDDVDLSLLQKDGMGR